MKVSEEVADKGRYGKGNRGGSEENEEPSQRNSDPAPSGREPSSAASEQSKPGLAGLKGGRRILIVDDEANIADTLALIFKMRRYDVRVEYSAEGAIELMAEWRPDLAILDVMLPAMNGIDLAIAIKANYASCHVILFSGHANTATLLEEAAKKGHYFEIVAKPVYPDVMLDRASELLTMPDEPAYD